jgi:transposase
MPKQLALRFDEVPVTDKTQERYHAIAPCLAGRLTVSQQAAALDLSYRTISRWLRQFREEGMPGLFPVAEFPREPQTPERIIVMLVYYKCCVPSASDRELARVASFLAERRVHNETVKALLARYPFWRYTEFRAAINYPVPADREARRLEMLKLRMMGWTEKRIAQLLQCSRKTVMKWLRRARQSVQAEDNRQAWLLDLSRAPHRTQRKVFFGTINAVLQLQKKYGYAGAFRLQGYLSKDYGLELSEATIRKVMRQNRQVHLAPQRPVELIIRDPREGPPQSKHPFEHAYIDIRYLDAKPEGIQLYSTLLLEGHSRTILAGSLTRRQDLGVVLSLYYLALLCWGCWEQVISDHGKQFDSHAFGRVNRRLQINHQMYEKGHPWQNLIESQFGIQARLGEYHWERCQSVEAAQEFHRELIRDHNRLPHFAHRKRQDKRHAPLEVLSQARGREVDAATLHRAFSRMTWKRKTDQRGFVRVNRWKIYIEEGLPRTPVQVTYWDGKLRAEYESHLLTEYRCRWDKTNLRPKAISQPLMHSHPFQSRQPVLFDPLWVRDPIESDEIEERLPRKVAAGGEQMRLYLGPELIKSGK